MRIPMLALCLAALPTAPASAQLIHAEDLAAFVERSDARFRRVGEPDLENVLYQIAWRNPVPETAVAEFARRLGVSIDIANTYAAAMIESLGAARACLEGL